MVLKYVLCSVFAVVAAARSASLPSHDHAGLCSGPCPAQPQHLGLVQRHATVEKHSGLAQQQQEPETMMLEDKVIQDKHKVVQEIARFAEKHEAKQELAKLDEQIAKQKDLVVKEINEKHQAKQLIVKLEKELGEQMLDENDTVLTQTTEIEDESRAEGCTVTIYKGWYCSGGVAATYSSADSPTSEESVMIHGRGYIACTGNYANHECDYSRRTYIQSAWANDWSYSWKIAGRGCREVIFLDDDTYPDNKGVKYQGCYNFAYDFESDVKGVEIIVEKTHGD